MEEPDVIPNNYIHLPFNKDVTNISWIKKTASSINSPGEETEFQHPEKWKNDHMLDHKSYVRSQQAQGSGNNILNSRWPQWKQGSYH